MTNHHENFSLPTDELELIAFHLGEECDEKAIRARLQSDEAYAALSQSINQALRVYSASPVPMPDTDAAWHRLRTSLPVFDRPKKTPFWRWFLVPAAVVALLILAASVLLPGLRHKGARQDDAGVIQLRPPASGMQPRNVSDHLDRAERWLTTVNHASASLDQETHAEGQQLLLQNAVYLRDARSRGDLPDAAVLEHLERVLTAANHTDEGGMQLRIEMNTDGLLFDLRILRQNHSYSTGESQ